MLIQHQNPHNKSIILAVVGAPNVGKSSLINCLIGTDLAIVSSKAQTTRNRYNCIFQVDHTEIILTDTPGVHLSNQEINKRMNEQAIEGTEGADVNLLLVDLSKEVLRQVVEFQELLAKNQWQLQGPVWILFTKADQIEEVEKLPWGEVFGKIKELLPTSEKYFIISAVSGLNIHQLMGAICDRAPAGPHLYPNGEISNRNERFFVSEYIREQAFELLKEELPYEMAVVVEEFRDILDPAGEERTEVKVAASILVNRPSQRAIVVGASGQMIKEIGMRARKKIEALTGVCSHLNLHVKVSPRWFKNNFVLEELGLPRAKNSTRVWRKT